MLQQKNMLTGFFNETGMLLLKEMCAVTLPQQEKEQEMTSTKRWDVTLTGEILETLEQIAEQRKIAISEVLSQAIGHEKFLSNEVRAGNRILIEGKNPQKLRELVIPSGPETA